MTYPLLLLAGCAVVAFADGAFWQGAGLGACVAVLGWGARRR